MWLTDKVSQHELSLKDSGYVYYLPQLPNWGYILSASNPNVNLLFNW